MRRFFLHLQFSSSPCGLTICQRYYVLRDNDGETSESGKSSMPVYCELDAQGMLMTYGLPLPSPDLLVDGSVHVHMFHQ
ncbi:hypothetical protein P3S68_019376 [Capsicum galapagoense]